jgi:pimeloyl-ACP methyl ester carboxylesterase
MTTLVTIPGIMSDERTWASLVERLKDRVSTIHIADTTQDSTLEAMAARALAATRGDLFVVAHSMGGRIAMEMGRQDPGRIKAMVLSSTGVEGPSNGEAPRREARIAEANAGMTDYARNWIPTVVSKANMADGPLVERTQKMVEDCPADVHERQSRALLNRPDATRYLGSLDFPVLLLTGAEDHLSTAASHAAIAALLKDAEARVIEGSGHLLPFEQPTRVAETVVEWLDRRRIGLS